MSFAEYLKYCTMNARVVQLIDVRVNKKGHNLGFLPYNLVFSSTLKRCQATFSMVIYPRVTYPVTYP